MGTEKGRLHDLAAAIADGRAVDWDRVVSESSEPDARARVEQFRLIARIAGAHGSRDDSTAVD